MKGWVTWSSAAGFALLGVADIVNGVPEAGMQKLVYALGLVGLGRKIEKNKAEKAVEHGK